MFGNSAFNPNATGTAARFQVIINGIHVRPDTNLGPVQISLQGPGGQSTMRFTCERASSGTSSPFRGRAPVEFYDTLSDLRFKGFITHTQSRRSQGSLRVTDVDVAGLDKQLDERLVISFKTRSDTGTRKRKFTDDGPLVKAILKHGNLDAMIVGGYITTTTSGDLDDMTFTKQTVRECLTEIADVAQPETAYALRRFYVDGGGSLHYYSGTEGLAAPYRINEDARYLATMTSATGVASFWSGRFTDAGNAYDHKGSTNATTNGNVAQVNSLCIGHRELPAMRFNGVSYLSASDATLHPGNTGSWGMVFKRRGTGSAQTLWSGGTDDILIGFDSSDHLIVQKEGTAGNGFISDSAYTSTTNSYHLVVTHSPGNGFLVYLNGALVSGTTNARTLVAGSGAVNVGRKKSTTDTFYLGTLWGVWVSSSEFSAATISSQVAVWRSVEPQDFVIDRDTTDVTLKAWVTGANNIGSAWVLFNDAGDPNFEQVVTNAEGGPLQPEEFLDRPDAHTAAKRKKYGHSYMAAKAGTVVSATFTLIYDPSIVQISGNSSWTPGMLCYLTSQSAQGWTNKQLEVKQVDIDLLAGTGLVKYDITVGALPYSGLRKIRARSRGLA